MCPLLRRCDRGLGDLNHIEFDEMSVERLAEISEETLRKLRWVGGTTIMHVRRVVEAAGLEFKAAPRRKKKPLDPNASSVCTSVPTTRLRALIKQAERGWPDEKVATECPWCGRDIDHTPTCPAFTPEGEVR
jgi:hypothetical protein